MFYNSLSYYSPSHNLEMKDRDGGALETLKFHRRAFHKYAGEGPKVGKNDAYHNR